MPTVLFASTLHFLVNFYLYYTTTVANVAEVSIRQFINNSYVMRGYSAGIDLATERWLWTLCLNGIFLGQAISSTTTAFFNERLGRRCSLIIGITAVLLLNVVDVIAIATHAPIIFIISRCSGYFFTMISGPAANMLVVEAMPKALRGPAMFFSGLTYNIILITASVCATDTVLGHHLPMLFALGLPFSLLALLMSVWLKESPTYALLTARDEKRAKHSLHFYHGRIVDVEEMFKTMLREEELNVKRNSSGGTKISDSSLFIQIKELLMKRHLRKAVLCSLCAMQVK